MSAIMNGLFLAYRHLCLPGITLNPIALEKGVSPGWVSFISSVVDMERLEMRSFCLLTSMELILISSSSLLYLHSNELAINAILP